MPNYVDNVPHAGSAEVLYTGMYEEPAGSIARTIPRHTITSNGIAAFTTGSQVAVNGLALPSGLITANIALLFGSTAANGPTHWWFALCDSQLNVLAVTADQTSTAITANLYSKLAVTIPFQIQYTGLYYIAASVTASTTAPTASGSAIVTGAAGPTTPILCGTAGTQAAPPAIGSQINSGTITNNTTCHFSAWIS